MSEESIQNEMPSEQNPDVAQEQIPESVLRRLPKYLAVAQVLEEMGWDFVTSADLARACEVKEMLVRKDLAWTGVVGRPRFGYPIHGLIGAVFDVVGWNHVRKAVFVGPASVAESLTIGFSFPQHGLQLVGVVDDAAAGSTAAGVRVLSFSDFIAEQGTDPINLAILCVPAELAQSFCDRLVAHGIRGIWNFAPTTLAVPQEVSVSDADLSSSLAILCHDLVRRGR